ncbi:GNAT family N-acetyltransferase [Oceanirhabdus seepicola]|uniref:GNAT family N-acetyltransferase n=1 Tax=Oceanirhabdus seepicola TaxID=2828781 RepID=A0A9J6NY36_9CLOT|nr:GNAT family N-acetyltransferase [Oceanirhabdus seepicola]MCM1988972.1 GNAT family N-acetyltransferase [Oceanirhabdus seepicola]
MKKIDLSNEIYRNRMLEFLYKDEMYNTNMIELVECFKDEIGEFYINEEEGKITEFIHMKDDGNSIFTSFKFSYENGIKDIANIIRTKQSEGKSKILLGGRLDNVHALLKELGDNRECVENIIFGLNEDKFNELRLKEHCSMREVTYEDKDLKIVKKYTVEFFGAETQEEFEKITSEDKIIPKITRGMFFLVQEEGEQENIIGMARFYGKTENYIEITSVYIDKDYRGRGFGKELIYKMIKEILRRGKTPILETSTKNIPAIKLYKSMGFVERDKYAFEFV